MDAITTTINWLDQQSSINNQWNIYSTCYRKKNYEILKKLNDALMYVWVHWITILSQFTIVQTECL